MRLEARKAESRDVPQVKRLIDEYIAEDYYSLAELEECLQGERNLFYVVTDADRSGAIISFFYAFLSTLDEALPLLHVSEKPEALRHYAHDTLVGVYKTSSTEREYQKHGICSSFIKEIPNQSPIQSALASSATYLTEAFGAQETESGRRTRFSLERKRKTCRKEYFEATGLEDSIFLTLESIMTER